MKKETKRRILIFAIYVIGVLLVPSGLYLLLSQFTGVDTFKVNFFTYVLLFIILAYPLFKVIKKQKKFESKNIWVIFGSQILMYFANFVINFLTIFIIAMITGQSHAVNVSSTNQNAINHMALNSNTILFLLMIVVLAPMIEELVFRYGVFKGIRNKHSFALAASVSAFLFGFMHVAKDLFVGNWLSFISIFTYASMGFFLCLSYEQTDDFKIPVLLHMLNNLISAVLILSMH